MQYGASEDKFEPMFCYLSGGFSMYVTDYANLGYRVDRSNPSNSIILGTGFANALADVEQYIDFSEVPCSVSIEHNWDSSTRQIIGDVNVSFDATPAGGDYRVMLMVVQDSIIYKQYDYGMSSDYGIPDVDFAKGYIDSFVHNHVVRDGIIDGDSVWGEYFTSDPSNGESFSISFDYTLPERYEFSGPGTANIPDNYDPEKVWDNKVSLVAYVSREKSEVVNSASVKLAGGNTANSEYFSKANSSSGLLKLRNGILKTYGLKASSVEIYNLSGKTIDKIYSDGIFNLNELNLSMGQYLLVVKDRTGKEFGRMLWLRK